LVSFLWTDGQRIFFSAPPFQNRGACTLCLRFRDPLRLIAADRSVELTALQTTTQLFATPVTSAVHRFEESIAGRPYLIEVAAVSKDRWRAYIVRIPGIPTALMPFYGSTPVEAARRLCEWLTRAHARASAPSGPVSSV
jgi:hypothetical protein